MKNWRKFIFNLNNVIVINYFYFFLYVNIVKIGPGWRNFLKADFPLLLSSFTSLFSVIVKFVLQFPWIMNHCSLKKNHLIDENTHDSHESKKENKAQQKEFSSHRCLLDSSLKIEIFKFFLEIHFYVQLFKLIFNHSKHVNIN